MIRASIPNLAILLGLILAGAAGSCTGQPPSFGTQPPSSPTQDSIRRAFEAMSNGDLDAANTAIDAALKRTPEDRQALGLASMFAVIGADKAQTTTQKVALLRRAISFHQRLKTRYQPLEPQEASLDDLVGPSTARILALEGKPELALDALAQLVAAGYPNLDAINQNPDYKTVRALPAFRTKLAAAVTVGVKAALEKNKPFPFDFDLKDVDGKTVKLADVRGAVTIVDVWGTWCPPCREEIPHFVDLLTRYEAQGLRVVGINCNEEGSPAEVKRTIDDFKADQKIRYPCVLNDDTTEAKIPGFQGYPTTLFLDRAGRVRLVLVGYTPLIRLEAIITTLLAEPKL